MEAGIDREICFKLFTIPGELASLISSCSHSASRVLKLLLLLLLFIFFFFFFFLFSDSYCICCLGVVVAGSGVTPR